VVRRGDTVKLHSKDVDPSVSGAHFRVEFVIGETLIIFSPAINSNRGLMAVPCSQVETPGSQKVKTKGLKKRRRGGRKRKGKGKGVSSVTAPHTSSISRFADLAHVVNILL
jgi:hypothetical protein